MRHPVIQGGIRPATTNGATAKNAPEPIAAAHRDRMVQGYPFATAASSQGA